MRRDTIGFLTRIAADYGDIVHFGIGPFRIVLLNHPDLVKEVLSTQHANFTKGRPLQMAKKLLGEGLLTSEGELHKRQSRIIQPAFHARMVDSYGAHMTACIGRMMDGWHDGMRVDIRDEMIKLSMAIAGRTLFGTNVEGEAREIIRALEDATSLFERISIPFSEWFFKLPLPGNNRFNRAKARLDETVNRIIDDRRRHPLDNGDVLSLLLNAQRDKENGGGISDQQVRDEVLTLLLTAFDTTSNALTWTWHLLSQHPQAEAELHGELERVLNGRLPTTEDIPELKYTRMVFGESMRMFPPSYVIARQALADFQIDRYRIPGGTIVLMSPYLIHHDPRFRKAPGEFDPHAWHAHAESPNAKYEYFPFGGGPRACIGQPFAWLEGMLVLASVAQSWRLEHVPDHPVVPEQRINLRPKNGMTMILRLRN